MMNAGLLLRARRIRLMTRLRHYLIESQNPRFIIVMSLAGGRIRFIWVKAAFRWHGDKKGKSGNNNFASFGARWRSIARNFDVYVQLSAGIWIGIWWCSCQHVWLVIQRVRVQILLKAINTFSKHVCICLFPQKISLMCTLYCIFYSRSFVWYFYSMFMMNKKEHIYTKTVDTPYNFVYSNEQCKTVP